ncbi:UDP-glucose 4-epimerase [Candidatus Uhrbacteria bacterium CG_4_9_14_3_um_filter_36_7]|uniref:UDP-glucose 4-epimerase n=1 Tax=Candidatus Uhrbacteria bacterium CG_4_9_14_3_um_filter_36_7 TaxID=1975033 RepID=A0A2M7XHH4_9BACT|nr:MAG: UDP-glucose 4-epimerase [Candidatus Uhrbacteria bacterium CG_4_9_14_3_um_filter_36_7]
MKKIVVTGGAGFIGSHLVDALIEKKYDVYVADDLSFGTKAFVHPKAHFFRVSILNPKFFSWLEKVHPEAIFHLAAQTNVRLSLEDPVCDAKINIFGSIKLALKAKELGVKKIIFSSTGGAMFSNTKFLPYKESVPINPISPYGIAKAACEQYLQTILSESSTKLVILRYANVYGPRQSHKGEAGVVSIFVRRLLENKPLTVFGDGMQTRDFIYVRDVVQANIAALSSPSQGIFHIGTGKEVSLKELLKRLTDISQLKLTVQYSPFVKGELSRSALCPRKALKELGWKPLVSLDQGLSLTLQGFKEKI